ncbi:MAG: hypothetical protein JXQ76_12530 [Campylobacterales bacterium]|nr:hypothetical protein [Campylobacterales bacterium]
MLEVDISYAKSKFDTLLTQEVVIVDNEHRIKQAVLLPYTLYNEIMQKVMRKDKMRKGSFNQFQGILSQDFQTNDSRYRAIIES